MSEETKILIGMKKIMDYYQIGSEEKFYKLVKEEKMPCKKIVGSWVGSVNKINEWFEEKTCQT